MLLAITAFVLAQVPIPNLGDAPTRPTPAITASCSDLTPRFTSIANDISSAGSNAADAGMNAKGLGYFSPPRHFHTVENDYANAMKSVNDGLDIATAVDGALRNAPQSASTTAARGLLDADQHALLYVRQYAQVAVTYQRAVNAKNLSEQAALSWTFSNAFNPTISNSIGTATSQQDANVRQLTADQARGILEQQNDDVRDVRRSLVVATQAWNARCGY